MELLNALVVLANFVLIPALAYGSSTGPGSAGRDADLWHPALFKLCAWRHHGVRGHDRRDDDLVAAKRPAFTSGRCPLPSWPCRSPFWAAWRCSWPPTALSIASTASRRPDRLSLVIVSMGVMFIMNGLVRFIIGPGDRRFADGERFIISAREFKTLTGLNEGLAIKTTQGLTLLIALIWHGPVILVPQPDPRRQIHARLFLTMRSWRCSRASTPSAWCWSPG